MVDALLSSPNIPLGVNVLRLAADYDTEGVTAMARSITVRYVGSDANTIRDIPLVITRTLSFEVTHASQSYLSQSGHDYALQMCAGAALTLSNTTPVNTGAQITKPLFLASERFEGLTDSSHYVYVQTWSLDAEEIYPVPPIDPCVWRGNCSYLFPSCSVQEVLPGDVLYTNVLYSPVLPPPEGENYDPSACGVKLRGNDLVYKYDDSQVFLEDWMDYKLVSTEQFDETGKFLRVNVYDLNGAFIKWYYASNCDCRTVIQIAGFAQNSANWLGGLWRSPIGQDGNVLTSSGPEPFLPAVMQAKNAYGYVAVPATLVFETPGDLQGVTAQVKWGVVYPTLSGVTKTEDGQEYYMLGRTPIGKAWIRKQDFALIDYNPRTECDDDAQITDDGNPSVGGSQTGKIDSCE